MRRSFEKFRLRLSKTPNKAVVLAAFMLLMFTALVPVTYACDLVTLTDENGNEHVTIKPASSSPEEILEKTGYEEVHVEGVRYLAAALPQEEEPVEMPVVNRLFSVEVLCDGEVLQANAVTGTVADVLQKCGIELNGQDYVSPSLDTPINSDIEIEIKRVSYFEESIRTDVSAEAVEAYLLNANEAESFKINKSGIYDVTYLHTVVNGEVIESEIKSLMPVISPRDGAGTGQFEENVPYSTIDGFSGVELGEDGVPVNYSKKITGAVTTAYSSRGGKGSSGLGLYCGTVAVNPAVIPYGSKMFITSADGKYVYGYAIATDTGVALMDGRIDIDIYFESNAECLRFGKRGMDVYIFE